MPLRTYGSAKVFLTQRILILQHHGGWGKQIIRPVLQNYFYPCELERSRRVDTEIVAVVFP